MYYLCHVLKHNWQRHLFNNEHYSRNDNYFSLLGQLHFAKIVERVIREKEIRDISWLCLGELDPWISSCDSGAARRDGHEPDGTHLSPSPSRWKYLRREMAELCTALIRTATEFPRDRKTKIITDVSARLSVPDEGADVRNEWIASTDTSRRRVT